MREALFYDKEVNFANIVHNRIKCLCKSIVNKHNHLINNRTTKSLVNAGNISIILINRTVYKKKINKTYY